MIKIIINLIKKLMGYLSSAGGGDKRDLGYYATSADLSTAHPTANGGDFAVVGDTDTIWVWDTGTSTWVDTGGATLPIASGTVLGGIKVGDRLTIDGNGVLSADVQGGGSFIGCRVNKSGDLTVADNTNVTVDFGVEEFDTDNMHDNSTNNSRITFNTAGYYSFGYGFQTGTGAVTGNMGAFIKNQDGIILAETRIVVNNNQVCESQVTGMTYFNAGEYITAVAIQQTGVSQVYYTNTSYSNRFWAYKVG
jgi:hypothetical protein